MSRTNMITTMKDDVAEQMMMMMMMNFADYFNRQMSKHVQQGLTIQLKLLDFLSSATHQFKYKKTLRGAHHFFRLRPEFTHLSLRETYLN